MKETRMKKFASALVILACMTAAACKAAPSNLLIGTWRVDTSGVAPNPGCANPLTFGEKTRTEPDVNGQSNTIPVTYVAGESTTFPTVVYVMTDAGIEYHTTFRFLSKDKMIMDTAAQCPYVRQ
jgi:hypothetical protein